MRDESRCRLPLCGRFKEKAGQTSRLLCLRFALVVMLVGLLVAPGVARAQFVDEAFESVGISNELSVGGSVGMVGELYGTSLATRRRPASSGRLFARAQASGYGLRYGLDLVLSTEQYQFTQNARRQSINEITLNLEYKWIETDIGRVSRRFSEYSLNGVMLSGGFVELTPGKWRLAFTSGVSQRASEPTPLSMPGSSTTTAGPSPRLGVSDGVFQRWIHAARLGYGDPGGSHVDVIGLYGYDDASSLRDPGAVSPTSNTSVTTAGGVRLWGQRVRVEGQVTASGFVNDTQAPLSDTSPGLFYDAGLMNARVGSQMNYAGRLSAEMNVTQRGGMEVSYERIQPGFRSLGVPYLRSDQEVIQLRPRVEFFRGKIRLNGQLAQRQNNLNGDLQSTLQRRQAGLNAQVRVSRMLFVTTSYSRLINENQAVGGAPEASVAFEQVSQTVSLSPSLTVQRGSTSHSATLTGSFQTLADRRAAPGAVDAGFDNYSGTLSYTLALPSGTSVGLSGNALMSQRATTDLLTTSVNVNAGRSVLDRTLRINLGGGWSSNRLQTDPSGMIAPPDNTTQQFTASSNITYQIPSMGDVSFRIRALQSGGASRGDFNEIQSTIRYEYRF